jgi:hypothetical protein
LSCLTAAITAFRKRFIETSFAAVQHSGTGSLASPQTISQTRAELTGWRRIKSPEWDSY